MRMPSNPLSSTIGPTGMKPATPKACEAPNTVAPTLAQRCRRCKARATTIAKTALAAYQRQAMEPIEVGRAAKASPTASGAKRTTEALRRIPSPNAAARAFSAPRKLRQRAAQARGGVIELGREAPPSPLISAPRPGGAWVRCYGIGQPGVAPQLTM